MTQRALVDTNVVYGAFRRRDQFHEEGLAVVRAADRGDLPTLVVIDFVLAEVMNALTRQVPHDDAVRALSMLEESTGVHLNRTTSQVWQRGVSVYREQAQLSLVDALLVAVARDCDLPYVYSFDTGFDSVDGVRRLTTPTNPYRA
ncbi:type II toxin-antitoxin system VapC family toxin [Halomarina pelagica]|uniref:type II toxin-antitoxin system VapC family toxin n=1 Tax=Halomarina pelagica TaxID=2961599 RepID=UPI0020C3290E|nr:PIN domain-containing protein [Halomarina sp. BND7]